MRQTNWPLIAILLMVVLAAGFCAGFYLHRHADSPTPPPPEAPPIVTLPPERTPPPPPAGNAARPESPQTAPTSTSAPAPTTIPTTTTATTTLATTTATTTPTTGPGVSPLPPPSTLDARGAAKALDSGLDLLKHDKTIEARTALSAAFLSGRLTPRGKAGPERTGKARSKDDLLG